MKGLSQNPLLVIWLSQHLSGLMRRTSWICWERPEKSHTHSNCHFISQCFTLNVAIFALATDGGYSHAGLYLLQLK
jgi:hypothetical protein